MKYGKYLFFLLFFVIAIPALAQAPQETRKHITQETFIGSMKGADAAEIGADGLIDLLEKGNALVLDVRGQEAFAARHLKGSLNLPLTDLTEKTLAAAIPDKTTDVIIVCDYSFAPVRMLAMTLQAWPVLKTSGYENVYRLNLWQGKNGGEMLGEKEQEKILDFEMEPVRVE